MREPRLGGIRAAQVLGGRLDWSRFSQAEERLSQSCASPKSQQVENDQRGNARKLLWAPPCQEHPALSQSNFSIVYGKLSVYCIRIYVVLV
ncbi:hypothetical protein N7468_008172 [Penicillium chermesinum]|uniref:Uncharacterized protein n=1 Tax=Penicillium chermesinum TaxID=63820 RepID=A0A9W9NP82_9EURO|nr:uncharacterized protein N7468_008172 [Penicillium chermesinum]KAJ5223630.1 hypothetical protein N7468_008172 [Penicillium chermesinum]